MRECERVWRLPLVSNLTWQRLALSAVTRGEDLVACDLNQRSDPFFVAKWVGPGDNSPEFTSPVRQLAQSINHSINHSRYLGCLPHQIVYKTLRPDWVVAAADKNVSLDVVQYVESR